MHYLNLQGTNTAQVGFNYKYYIITKWFIIPLDC